MTYFPHESPKKKRKKSPPGASVHGILQARIMKWVAIPFSRGSSQPRTEPWVSHIAGRFRSLGLLYCRQILYYLSHQGSLITSRDANELVQTLFI